MKSKSETASGIQGVKMSGSVRRGKVRLETEKKITNEPKRLPNLSTPDIRKKEDGGGTRMYK